MSTAPVVRRAHRRVPAVAEALLRPRMTQLSSDAPAVSAAAAARPAPESETRRFRRRTRR
ncbi:conserved protein of unknown function [Blastococcus saxobsidens DD2]|uniref:Uncharacterized protein n=1 Tax=Blastococcus saxobsidens (strain DD2) TaxID=1146883 RepID=H6RS88_BLASD|nr:conserved protein of unknown function [Blastococcus saxobsidens DD2]